MKSRREKGRRNSAFDEIREREKVVPTRRKLPPNVTKIISTRRGTEIISTRYAKVDKNKFGLVASISVEEERESERERSTIPKENLRVRKQKSV